MAGMGAAVVASPSAQPPATKVTKAEEVVAAWVEVVASASCVGGARCCRAIPAATMARVSPRES